MPRLIRIDSGDDIGQITDAQLKFLTDQLGSEDDEDHCVINANTLELLSDNNAEPELLALLEKGLDGDDSMDIAWE
jgi:hypothetical protein